MSTLKSLVYLALLIALGSCATRLENSQEYLFEGDKKSAIESLLEHAKENSIEDLSSQESKTGIDFLTLLEKANSPSLLTQIYDLKFSPASFQKNYFLYSGRFSKTLLSLAQKWQMSELQDRMAMLIESEISYVKGHKYDKEIMYFSSFASVHLSVQKKSHSNLSKYWTEIPFEKYLDGYESFWNLAISEKAQSVHEVLKENLLTRMKDNREQILKVAEQKEISFIFKQESQYTEKSGFNELRVAMQQSINEGKKTEKVALDEIEQLKPRVLTAADRLHKLETERRDLQSRNQYTYEERVQCRVCIGRGEVQCGPCGGRGECRSCDRGRIECGRCFRRGILDCGNCRGRGSYRDCRRVWDSHKRCYVETYVRVNCHSCFGSGHIDCGCFHGRIVCRRCDGHFQCRTCLGRRFVSCSSCVNGSIIEVRKTTAGKDIDNRISAAETHQSALLSRLNGLEYMVRRERSKRKIFNEHL
ncbi:MAG: hypothetical protein NE327_05835 [Lentisphaeraceae bacterium]|nr:hypothetical protein [Lentisphaeraceae bacterium]